jgi:hypothetical protein
VTIPRSDRGRDRDSRSSRRSSSRSDSRDDSRSDRRLEAAARAKPVTALYGPNFVEVTPLQMALGQAAANRPAAQAAANRKIGVVPK